MDLAKALRVTRSSRVALTGAGGKTTALFQLARALEPPVVVTCSTHMGIWQGELADRHLVVTRAEDVERFTGQIEGVTLLTGEPGDDQRLKGLDLDALAVVRDLADRLNFPVLVEGDGSRQLPLKAPGEREPVIPSWINHVVVTVGLSGLGKPLTPETVHRAERFAALSGQPVGEAITAAGIENVLVHPQGGLKGIPAGARKTALLNQADTPELLASALRIAMKLTEAYDAVVVSELDQQKIWRVVEPTAGILLAGGESRRLGQPKALLPWRGQPLVRHAAETALAAGLQPVVVITGAVEQPVRDALAGLPVMITHNADWQMGQSTSVRSGLGALPENTGAAVFLLADQPFITPDLLTALVERHQETLAAVVAPRVAGRRANPVLFDRETFASLLALQGDTGGRAILDRYALEYLDWPDERLLLDIDTPEDYQRLKGLE